MDVDSDSTDLEYTIHSVSDGNSVISTSLDAKEELLEKIRLTKEQVLLLRERLSLEKQVLNNEIIASKQLADDVAKQTGIPPQYPVFFQPPSEASYLPFQNTYDQYTFYDYYRSPNDYYNTNFNNTSSFYANPSSYSMENWAPYYPQCNAPVYPRYSTQSIASSSVDLSKQQLKDSIIYSRAQTYRGELEHVERECDHELSRMRDSIMSLRKIKRYWSKFEDNILNNNNNVSFSDYNIDSYKGRAFKKRHYVPHRYRYRKSNTDLDLEIPEVNVFISDPLNYHN